MTANNTDAGDRELREAWAGYHAVLEEMRQLIESTPRFRESPADHAKAYHAMMEVQAMAYNFTVAPRMLHPRIFTRLAWQTDTFTLAQNCQDFLYSTIFLDGRQRYRMRGRMGDICLFLAQSFNGSFGEAGIKTIGNYDWHDFAIGADGRFEVTISSSREPGNWIQLDPDVPYQMILLRRAITDWHGDRGELTIERISDIPDDHYDADEFDGAATAARIRRATAFVRFIIAGNVIGLYDVYHRKNDLQKNVLTLIAGESSGLGANVSSNYAEGVFNLQADEALVMTMAECPNGVYWSYQLGDVWSRSLDFANHQSSLNLREAAIDSDGALRVVIARQDPGINNWLDPCGRQQGTIVFRNYRARSAPVPTVAKLKLADLAGVLPPDTRRVKAAERQRAMAWRRQGQLKLYGE